MTDTFTILYSLNCKVTIVTSNAAFGDTPAERNAELARLFHDLATRLQGEQDHV